MLNQGATAIIPEPIPGQQVSVLSDETRTQAHLCVGRVGAARLAARGMKLAEQKGPLCGRRVWSWCRRRAADSSCTLEGSLAGAGGGR